MIGRRDRDVRDAGDPLEALRDRGVEDHQEAADELARVCRPGGTIALLSWTPQGMIGALFRR